MNISNTNIVTNTTSTSTSIASESSMITSSNDTATDDNECSSLSLFIEDQRNIDRDKKMPYILMLGRGIHDSVPKLLDISNIQPFKKALELNVIKKKPLSLSKQLLCQELKRRNPGKKLNINNKKVDDLFAMFWIQRNWMRWTRNMKERDGVEEVETRKRDMGGIEMTDRLRYILAIDLCGDVRECYLRSQDVMDRQALDARNTDAGASSDTVPSMTSYYSSRKKQKTEASDLIQKGISTNVKAVGTALSRMNQQSAMMSDINNLIHT
eukprot:CAMPEP_0176490482 /NCGR_PEP_ID=MMETSP0200_2-20121128/7893_1 /TAXON_ID=947934 /ORGANISM="Chaetoceros sp., Strain GSL56" /LENGTH=267 /DNA_ID=CAMNT_0017887789 /DNA_START=64 /DNA_END=868 /DNA_ORIENTATION=+